MAQSWVWGWEKAERCREQQLLEKDDESALGSLRYFGGFEGCFVGAALPEHQPCKQHLNRALHTQHRNGTVSNITRVYTEREGKPKGKPQGKAAPVGAVALHPSRTAE